MKSKDDPNSEVAGEVTVSSGASIRRTGSAPDASSLSSFIQQEQLCKELYLSMGVHPNDVADTSDDDVTSILEQMNRFHPSAEEPGGGGDRNIEDILREAESLLDGQHGRLHSRPKSSSIYSRSGSVASSTLHEFKFNLEDDPRSSVTNQKSYEQRLMNITRTINSAASDIESSTKQTDIVNPGGDPPHQAFKTPKRDEMFVPSHIVGTPLEVTYKRIYEQMRKEVDGSLQPHLIGDFPDLKLSLPIPGLDTPSFDAPGCFSLEQEFLEERKRCLKLKADLDWLKKQHEREVAELRRRHEGQLNQVREELCVTVNQDPSITALQSELKAQEQIILSYKEDNHKLCSELKDIKRLLLKLMALLKADNGSVCIFP